MCRNPALADSCNSGLSARFEEKKQRVGLEWWTESWPAEEVSTRQPGDDEVWGQRQRPNAVPKRARGLAEMGRFGASAKTSLTRNRSSLRQTSNEANEISTRGLTELFWWNRQRSMELAGQARPCTIRGYFISERYWEGCAVGLMANTTPNKPCCTIIKIAVSLASSYHFQTFHPQLRHWCLLMNGASLHIANWVHNLIFPWRLQLRQ